MMRRIRAAARLLATGLLAPALLVAVPSLAGSQTGVSLTLRDGRVTLRAENASVRQILAEWQRLGQIRIVGIDKLAATQPLTLTLTDVPERQALDIVLRAVPGYMVVNRAEPVATLSRYDRLLLMPRTTTAVSAVASGPAPATSPAPAPVFVPTPAPDQDGIAVAMPDRDDVEQFADGEPPMPTAPVMNPYPGGGAAGPAGSGPYGGNAAAAAASGANVEGNPPETQFDYANPQKYFERMRAMQQQAPAAGTQPGAVAPGGLPPGTSTRPGPSAVPTAPGATLNQPGISPTPQQAPPAGQGQFFNPYNLPADYVPPPATAPTGPPVEPDRAKYANPYVPQTRPPD